MIIKTLRRKFIAATMLSLAAVLLVILGGVNLMSYQKVISDAEAILELLCANSGTFPEFPTGKRPAQAAAQPPISADKPGFGDRGLSPETPYESRYFSVVLAHHLSGLRTHPFRIPDYLAGQCEAGPGGTGGGAGATADPLRADHSAGGGEL